MSEQTFPSAAEREERIADLLALVHENPEWFADFARFAKENAISDEEYAELVRLSSEAISIALLHLQAPSE